MHLVLSVLPTVCFHFATPFSFWLLFTASFLTSLYSFLSLLSFDIVHSISIFYGIL